MLRPLVLSSIAIVKKGYSGLDLEVEFLNNPSYRKLNADNGGNIQTLIIRNMELQYYLILSALLFTTGVIGVLVRRNAIIIFMCIELMLNAANLAFVAISRKLG